MKAKDSVPPAPDFWGRAMYTGRLLRGYTLREIHDGTSVPIRLLAQYESGRLTPDPVDFVRVWSFLSTDPPPPRKAP